MTTVNSLGAASVDELYIRYNTGAGAAQTIMSGAIFISGSKLFFVGNTGHEAINST